MHNGGHRQFLNKAIGELDQAVGLVREPQVLLVALGRHDVAQEGIQSVLRGRCCGHSLCHGIFSIKGLTGTRGHAHARGLICLLDEYCRERCVQERVPTSPTR